MLYGRPVPSQFYTGKQLKYLANPFDKESTFTLPNFSMLIKPLDAIDIISL